MIDRYNKWIIGTEQIEVTLSKDCQFSNSCINRKFFPQERISRGSKTVTKHDLKRNSSHDIILTLFLTPNSFEEVSLLKSYKILRFLLESNYNGPMIPVLIHISHFCRYQIKECYWNYTGFKSTISYFKAQISFLFILSLSTLSLARI